MTVALAVEIILTLFCMYSLICIFILQEQSQARNRPYPLDKYYEKYKTGDVANALTMAAGYALSVPLIVSFFAAITNADYYASHYEGDDPYHYNSNDHIIHKYIKRSLDDEEDEVRIIFGMLKEYLPDLQGELSFV